MPEHIFFVFRHRRHLFIQRQIYILFPKYCILCYIILSEKCIFNEMDISFSIYPTANLQLTNL